MPKKSSTSTSLPLKHLHVFAAMFSNYLHNIEHRHFENQQVLLWLLGQITDQTYRPKKKQKHGLSVQGKIEKTIFQQFL
jgi:hypothetical protein